jgi:hypothetical protein
VDSVLDGLEPGVVNAARDLGLADVLQHHRAGQDEA